LLNVLLQVSVSWANTAPGVLAVEPLVVRKSVVVRDGVRVEINVAWFVVVTNLEAVEAAVVSVDECGGGNGLACTDIENASGAVSVARHARDGGPHVGVLGVSARVL
jgi:hypothetical protein